MIIFNPKNKNLNKRFVAIDININPSNHEINSQKIHTTPKYSQKYHR